MRLKDLFSSKPDKAKEGLFMMNMPPGLSGQELVNFVKKEQPGISYLRCKKCKEWVHLRDYVAHECATVKW